MPELKEVFDMVSQKVEPDADAWKQQDDRHRRATRNRRVGAFALVAAMGIVAAVIAVNAMGADEERTGAPTEPIPSNATHVLFDLESGRMTALPASLAGGYSYVVSPDGTRLAYAPWPDPIGDDERLHIYVADLDGTGVRRATSDFLDEINPRWSPTGQLLYQRRNADSEELGNLYLLDPATGSTTKLTELGVFSSHHWFLSASFHPDGRSVLFNLPRGPIEDQVWDLMSIPATGGEPTLLRRNAAHGSYSPDGTTIAYLNSPGLIGVDFGARSIWLADADGGDPRRLVRGTNIAWPRWSPDGTRIAFEDDGAAYVVEVATGEVSRITDGGAPEWLDEDTLIVGIRT
jgi:Tol biopolymer transport system component